ncbi:MAG: hypothetical protein ACXWT4_13385 [Methylobacter sp.]
MRTRYNSHYLPFALLFLVLLPVASSHASGETTRVSVNSAELQVGQGGFQEVISADGRYVAFFSDSGDLVQGDTNGSYDIFVHDRLTGTATRVSVDSAGMEGNGSSSNSTPSISADGRYVAFQSWADNLVSGDTNVAADVFVHDRTTGKTTRVSVNSVGKQGNATSEWPSISADGRYVAFGSVASNLVQGDTNRKYDTFVHDRTTGRTTRVSVDSTGGQGNEHSGLASISANGRYVVFESGADNLVPGDANGVSDIFVHDCSTGETTRVSVNSVGVEENIGSGYSSSISADGRYVAFTSLADNLVPGDANGVVDAFVHDRLTGTTTRVSVDSKGLEGNSRVENFEGVTISADGRYVAFNSWADNLVPGDTNEVSDIFIHNRTNGKTTRVSVDSAGRQGNLTNSYGSISADGRYVAFSSLADNLVAGDTNHYIDVFVRDRWLNTSQSADLQLAVTSQPDSVPIGDVGRYFFTVTNNGPDNAESVTVIDSVSGGKVWSLTPTQGECSIAAVSVCRLHKLAVGESVTVRTVFKAKDNPLIQNLTVSAAPVDSNPDNNSVTVSTPVTP